MPGGRMRGHLLICESCGAWIPKTGRYQKYCTSCAPRQKARYSREFRAKRQSVIDRRRKNPVLRFWSKVPIGAPECWEWQGGRDSYGYGRFWVQARQNNLGAHTFAYEVVFGAVPQGLELDHLCRNKGCVRPDHLEPVTNEENIRRAIEARRLDAARG